MTLVNIFVSLSIYICIYLYLYIFIGKSLCFLLNIMVANDTLFD